MANNMARQGCWRNLLPTTFSGIVFLLVILALASITLSSNVEPLNENRSQKKGLSFPQSVRRHPYLYDAKTHSKKSFKTSGKGKRRLNLPPVTPKGPTKNEDATTKAESSRTSKRTGKQNHLLSSLKKYKFWERDFNQPPTKSEGPSVAFSRQGILGASDHYLDKSPFIQGITGQRVSNDRSYNTGKKRANIVLIMTDDLDVELGSLNYMPKLLRLLGEQGAMFSNSYTSTPMCCPSRSSMLTGMYIHNHEVYTNNQNCSSVLWQNTHERRSFATYLKDSGYKTGYFGKYLNRYNGTHVPAGWSEWVGLVGNSRYYNYSLNRNHRFVKYGNRYPQDYLPHVVTSDGISFLRRHNTNDDPFLLVMSYPAPHGPEDSAPEHSHRFFNASDHHTASFNYAPNPDKQWILQWTDRMGAMEMKFTDLLMTKRLQTLQSIDESVTKIIYELEKMKQLENTYVFFTSDHGYHLGQFGLAKGKSMPFEFDIKVPFFVRGPGIKPGSILPQISLNIDLAPTFLDIAGITAPAHMDGRSLLRTFQNEPIKNLDQNAWRDSFLVESSGRVRDEEELLKKEQRSYEREKALSMSLPQSSIKFAENGDLEIALYTSKHERFQEVCKQKKFKAPCYDTQKWFCVRNGDRWRLKKCRSKSSIWRKRCICQSEYGFGTFNKLDPHERRRQKKFIKRYVAKNKHGFNGKFIQSFNQLKLPLPTKKRHKHNRHSRRFIRSVDDVPNSDLPKTLNSFEMTTSTAPTNHRSSSIYDDDVIHATSYGANSSDAFDIESFEALSEEEAVHAFVAEEELKDLENQIIDISDELRILENITVNLRGEENNSKNWGRATAIDNGCNLDGSVCNVTQKDTSDMWRNSKMDLKDHILRLKQQLSVIKDIYTHLQETQPIPEIFPLEVISDDQNWKLKLNESNYQKKKYNKVDNDFVLGKDANLRRYFEKYNKKYDETNDKDSSPSISSKKSSHLSGSITAQRELGLKKWAALGKQEKNAEVGFDVEGMKLRPIALSSLLSDFTKLGNEALSPVCWCDERVFMKLEMQKRRSQRRIERKKLKEERHRRRLARRTKKKEKLQWCAHPNLHCFAHDNAHWRTPPLWNDGSFCFCISASNNTYWCLRTITEERNFLYCEFITGLVTYYDLHIDPYQLRNVAFTLSSEDVLQLHSKLTRLRTCSGKRECQAAEQFHEDSDLRSSHSAEDPSLGAENLSEPQNEVFLTKSFSKKNRNKKIKKLRRKLRRRLKKEKKQKKNKYVALLGLPESALVRKSQRARYSKKTLGKLNHNKRKRHRKHRRKRKSRRQN